MTHELSFRQWHHGYLGILLIVLALALSKTWLGFLGGYILVDDLLQHLIQWRWDDTYYSPLRFLYGKWLAWERRDHSQ